MHIFWSVLLVVITFAALLWTIYVQGKENERLQQRIDRYEAERRAWAKRSVR